MPRKPNKPPIICEFYSWKLFQRDDVYYADGRGDSSARGKHSLGTKDYQEALEQLRLLDHSIAVMNGLKSPSPALSPTNLDLGDGWESYLQYCQRPAVMGGVGAATFKRYRAVRDKHVAFCHQHKIQIWNDVSDKTTQQYGAWLTEQNYAYRSIYLELTLIKSVVVWLINEDRLEASCRLKFSLRKAQGTDTYCYSREQVGDMVAWCREHADLNWLGDILVALACTGLRISELADLRWSDVDLDTRFLRLTDERASRRRQEMGSARRVKSGRNRTLPLHDALWDALQKIPKQKDGRIFHGPRSGKLKPDTVRNILIKEVLTPLKQKYPTPSGEIGFEHGRLHSFRHYFCSQSFADGAAEADIRDWLGHHDSRMVAHYRHLSQAESQRRMQGIDFLNQGSRSVREPG